MSPDPDHQSRRASALRQNQQCYDQLVVAGVALCRPATEQELADPLHTVDPLGWLGGNIRGWKVLCLAAGGGRQSALYASAGADVTVFDLSAAMLELDRRVAQQRRLSIRVAQGSMDRLEGIANGAFDLVIHPVSTCYLPDVSSVFAEVSRVLRPGGLYVSQHKSPISLQASVLRGPSGSYTIEHSYYRTDPVPVPSQSGAVADRLRERGAVEYLHRLEQLIGGICRAGMVVEDFAEPQHAEPDAPRNSFADRAGLIAPYLRIKARRMGQRDLVIQ